MAEKTANKEITEEDVEQWFRRIEADCDKKTPLKENEQHFIRACIADELEGPPGVKEINEVNMLQHIDLQLEFILNEDCGLDNLDFTMYFAPYANGTLHSEYWYLFRNQTDYMEMAETLQTLKKHLLPCFRKYIDRYDKLVWG